MPLNFLEDQTRFLAELPMKPLVDCTEVEPGVRGLFLRQSVSADTPLLEYCGEITTLASFSSDMGMALTESPCPYVWMDSKNDLCIDARHRGNEARFVRRSCRPTAKIQPFQSDGQHVFLLVTTMPLGEVSFKSSIFPFCYTLFS